MIFIDQCHHQVTHDARLLAKVLYGGEGEGGRRKEEVKSKEEIKMRACQGKKSLSSKREVKFSSGDGKFLVHTSLICDEVHRDPPLPDEDKHEVDPLPPEHLSAVHLDDPCEDDPSCYVWRSQDYSFLPVKSPHQVNLLGKC